MIYSFTATLELRFTCTEDVQNVAQLRFTCTEDVQNVALGKKPEELLPVGNLIKNEPKNGVRRQRFTHFW